MKTADLKGAALDWAVAKCEGVDEYILETAFYRAWCDGRFNFSSDWTQGGPIIEKKKLELCPRPRGDMSLHSVQPADWAAGFYDVNEYEVLHIQTGSAPLIAAMRCYVASKLGNEVDVPEELK